MMQNDSRTFQTTRQDYTIQSDVRLIGKDALIVVTGVDHPHIGDDNIDGDYRHANS